MTIIEVTVPDGARVQLIDSRAGDELLVYHHGTPAAGPLHDDLLLPARDVGLRIVELVRPGYGSSTRRPGRSVADVADLADVVAHELGFDRYVTMGRSGGGPHALATVAKHPSRCIAGMCLAGVGMFDAADLDFLAGMGEENVDGFGAALAGEGVLRPYLEGAAEGLRAVTGDDVIAAMASLLSPADRAALTGEHGEWLAEELRWSVAPGIDGWLDDDIAFTRPWGFELAEVTNPITLWQGGEDLMVPLAHGSWLERHLPNVDSHLLAGHGHLSIAELAMREGFAFLRACLDRVP